MDFSFTEEQTLLRNSVQRFVQDRYDFDTRQSIVASEAGWRKDYWAQFADLGLLAASFPEELGGFGGTPVETMILMEEFGRGLVVEPFLPTVVLGGAALRHGGTTAQKEELIPQIIAGELILAFAFAEPQGRYNLADLKTTARKSRTGFVLNGQKSVVYGAPWADKLLVSARTAGGQRDALGVTLFLVDKNAPGVSTRDYPTVDGSRASEVTFENVDVPNEMVIGTIDRGLSLVERIVDEGIAAITAEAVGCMKMLTDTTVAYSKQRKQFGVAIGKFQVLQHRMVDMYMNYEQSVSMMYMITLKLGEDEAERKRAASATKVHIGKAGRFVGQEAVQIHGGMGVTNELNVGHYFKRLTMIDTMFGNMDYHMRRFTALSGNDRAVAVAAA